MYLSSNWVVDLASEQVSRQLAQEYRKVATHYHAGFLDASKIALPSEIDREHLDESGHAALADAIYKTITESGLLERSGLFFLSYCMIRNVHARHTHQKKHHLGASFLYVNIL